MAEDAKRSIVIIKKKIRHGGHHGGAWKVAYADFVTAMMSLFIVLWLMSTSQKTKEAIAGYFRDPLGRAKQVGVVKVRMSGSSGSAILKTTDDMKELQKKLEAVVKTIPNFNKLKANVEMKLTNEGLKIELMENSKGVFFDSGKPQPSELGRQVLEALSKEIGKIPNRVSIEGHTDSKPYDSKTYTNWDLSSDRANEARKLMEHDGLGLNQVSQIRGFADQALRDTRNPADPSNRRVSLIVQYAGEAPVLPDMTIIKPEAPAGSAAGGQGSKPGQQQASRY